MGKHIIVTFVVSALLITAISADFDVEDVENVTISPVEVLLNDDATNGFHKEPSEEVMKRAAEQIDEAYESHTSVAKYFTRYHGRACTTKSYNMFEITTKSEEGRVFWLRRVGIGESESDSDFVIVRETVS